MANTLARAGHRAARAAVIRTRQVASQNHLDAVPLPQCDRTAKINHQIVAEEMLLWGWRGYATGQGIPRPRRSQGTAGRGACFIRPLQQARASFLENELKLIDSLDPEFRTIAEQQSRRLVEAHERFSALMDKQRYQVVYPVLPMDLLGIYILLPEYFNAMARPTTTPSPYPWKSTGGQVLVLWALGGPTRPYKARVSLSKDSKEYAYYIRKHSSTIRAKGADEAELLSLAATVPFDDRFNQQAKVEDLSRELMQDYLKHVGSDLAKQAPKLSLI
jgi:hypothetical protein